jgi:hypothetical protein
MQAYDQHLNMILSEVEEIVRTVEIDEETEEEHIKVPHLSPSFLPFFIFTLLKSKQKEWYQCCLYEEMELFWFHLLCALHHDESEARELSRV